MAFQIDKIKGNMYVCTLDEASIKTAQRDLNEVPSERESQLEEFRRWIRCHKSWLKTPMGRFDTHGGGRH